MRSDGDNDSKIHLSSVFIGFISRSSSYQWQGYILAAAFFIVAMLRTIFIQQYYNCCFVGGMHMRTALTAAVYRKVSFCVLFVSMKT